MSIEALETSWRLWDVAHSVGRVLTHHGLPFGVWSGTHAAVIGGHRQSQDVDMWMPDAAIMPAYEALRTETDLPVTLDSHYSDRIMIGVGEQREVELMAHMDVHTPDGVFPVRYTKAVQNLGARNYYPGWKLPFAPVEDTIILKAILARGQEQGKHDIEDIVQLRDGTVVDQSYLMRRIAETGCALRVLPLLIKLDVATYAARKPGYDPVCSSRAPIGLDSGDLRCRKNMDSRMRDPTARNSLCQFWNDSNQNEELFM